MGRPQFTDEDHARRSATTAAALEAKRLHDGLTVNDVAAVLEISKSNYFNIRNGVTVRLQLGTCGRIARWLGVPAEDVLRWEGYWDEFSPVGRMLGPAMLQAEMGLRDLSETSGTRAETIWNSLTGQSCPEEDILERWADAIPMDFATLRRARSEMYKPPPDPKLAEQIRRTRKKEGRAGLRRLGERLQASLLEKTTVEERRANAAKGGAATRIYWERADEEDRARWALTHLAPRPKGKFGICRVCGKLTFLPAGPADGRRVEYHGECRKRWMAEDPAYGAWISQMRRGRRPEPPTKAYGVGNRAGAEELANYYETAVLYLRAKQRSALDQPYTGSVNWLQQLAVERSLSKRGILHQVDRLLNLLPDLSMCNAYFRPKVEALLTLRQE